MCLYDLLKMFMGDGLFIWHGRWSVKVFHKYEEDIQTILKCERGEKSNSIMKEFNCCVQGPSTKSRVTIISRLSSTLLQEERS